MRPVVFAVLLAFSTIAPSDSFARDETQKLIERLEKNLERLEKNLERLEKEVETLKAENVQLKKELETQKLAASKTEVGMKPDKNINQPGDVIPLGSVWRGSFSAATGGIAGPVQNADGRVILRGKDTFTISIKLTNGTNWEYDFRFTGKNKFELTQARRIKAADGVNFAEAPPLNGMTGTGTIKGKAMEMVYKLPNFNGKQMSSQHSLKFVE